LSFSEPRLVIGMVAMFSAPAKAKPPPASWRRRVKSKSLEQV
jgi:hypothetical protein